MRKLAAGIAGLFVVALAVYVGVGMGQNADRQTDKGVFSRGSVIIQEVIGAITLLLLALALWQAIRIWRGAGTQDRDDPPSRRSRVGRWLAACAGSPDSE